MLDPFVGDPWEEPPPDTDEVPEAVRWEDDSEEEPPEGVVAVPPAPDSQRARPPPPPLLEAVPQQRPPRAQLVSPPLLRPIPLLTPRPPLAVRPPTPRTEAASSAAAAESVAEPHSTAATEPVAEPRSDVLAPKQLALAAAEALDIETLFHVRQVFADPHEVTGAVPPAQTRTTWLANNVKVVFCQSCMGRGWQLRQALPINMALLQHWAGIVHFVVVLFRHAEGGDAEETSQWLLENCAALRFPNRRAVSSRSAGRLAGGAGLSHQPPPSPPPTYCHLHHHQHHHPPTATTTTTAGRLAGGAGLSHQPPTPPPPSHCHHD